MAVLTGAYPFAIDFDPPQAQNRLSVLLRLIFAIPILFVAAIVGFIAAIMTFFAWLAILATGKYPAGMASFVTGAWRMGVASQSYTFLLTDRYPPFSPSDELADYAVRPTGQAAIDGRNRLTVFFRLIMAIPHMIILYVLNMAGQVVGLIAWFAALFTGSVPLGLHSFLAGWQRWQARTSAYVLLLTDEYPPFSL